VLVKKLLLTGFMVVCYQGTMIQVCISYICNRFHPHAAHISLFAMPQIPIAMCLVFIHVLAVTLAQPYVVITVSGLESERSTLFDDTLTFVSRCIYLLVPNIHNRTTTWLFLSISSFS
jgi:hypothetical protein